MIVTGCPVCAIAEEPLRNDRLKETKNKKTQSPALLRGGYRSRDGLHVIKVQEETTGSTLDPWKWRNPWSSSPYVFEVNRAIAMKIPLCYATGEDYQILKIMTSARYTREACQ